MSRTETHPEKNTFSGTSFDVEERAAANTLPIDDAPRIVVAPGTEGRYGLCPISSLIANPHAVLAHPKRQIDVSVTGLTPAYRASDRG